MILDHCWASCKFEFFLANDEWVVAIIDGYTMISAEVRDRDTQLCSLS